MGNENLQIKSDMAGLPTGSPRWPDYPLVVRRKGMVQVMVQVMIQVMMQVMMQVMIQVMMIHRTCATTQKEAMSGLVLLVYY